MDIKIKMSKGCYYRNDMWFSPAYRKLAPGSRDLLQCLYTEIRKREIKKVWVEYNNGEVSFTEKEYKQLTGRCTATYVKAKKQLIEVGFVKLIHEGGRFRGDRALYKVLFGIKHMPISEERWRKYPESNWSDEIPNAKGNLVGTETRWCVGQSGRTIKIHPTKPYSNGALSPYKSVS